MSLGKPKYRLIFLTAFYLPGYTLTIENGKATTTRTRKFGE